MTTWRRKERECFLSVLTNWKLLVLLRYTVQYNYLVYLKYIYYY